MSVSERAADNDRAGAAGKTLLEIRGLRIEGQSDDRWNEIVKGIDLTLRRGEVLGLIGESGAGKSTIGLAAMGYARAGCRITAGTVVFDGVDLVKVGETQRRAILGARIAYVAQSAAAAFNPSHKLMDQCVEAPLGHQLMDEDAAKRNVVDLFHRLRLPDAEHFGSRYPHQVSGGQLQRAMTAMAMACRPDLIIFDEPTTALDVTTQIEVLAAIKNIVRQFATAAIYISHDLAVVAQMADRVMVLSHRELLEMIELDERFIDRLPSELSGGQKQRICIARALAINPELIICDEVTSALDQIVAEEILKLLLRLQKELGVSYLYITHDLATVRAIADEIVVMHQGRVVESGSKSQVLTPPHHDYTELLLSSVPQMDPDWLDGILAKRALAAEI